MKRNDINNAFDEMIPTHAQKERMLGAILLDGKTHKDASNKKVYTNPAIAVAMLLIALLTTALALNLGWNEKLLAYLGANEEQVASLTDYAAMPEDVAITDNGVTVTVKQTLVDSTGAYLVFDITVADDIALSDDLAFELDFFDLPTNIQENEIGIGSYSAPFVLSIEGNTATMLIHISQSHTHTNGTAKLTLRNLGYRQANGTFSTLVEGEWVLSWDFSYKDVSKTIYPDYHFTANTGECSVTKISVSPMSVCVNIENYEGSHALGYRPTLHFKDGTTFTYGNSLPTEQGENSFSVYLSDEATMTYTSILYHRFGTLIDVDSVESISIGDMSFSFETDSQNEN